MSRKPSSRSYLQQLAQPIVPGTTLLTARPFSTATEASPLVPVIENSFDMPDGTRTTFARSSADARRPAIDPIPSPPAVESAHHPARRDASAESPTNESPRVSARGPNLPPSRAEHHEQHPPASSKIERASTSASSTVPARSARVSQAREERLVEEPTLSETKKVAADRKEPERASVRPSQRTEEPRAAERAQKTRREPRTAQRVEADSDRNSAVASRSANDAPPSQSAPKDYLIERNEVQRASEAASAVRSPQSAAQQKAEKPEVHVNEGPRVHIGTVEIRAVLPQPIVPQPAVMAPNVAQNIAAAQARGRSGPAEPLARGLEWSYGLVQG
jgi:hypothetical protein